MIIEEFGAAAPPLPPSDDAAAVDAWVRSLVSRSRHLPAGGWECPVSLKHACPKPTSFLTSSLYYHRPTVDRACRSDQACGATG